MSLEKWPYNVEPGPNEHELFSIAVSLKRLADVAEKFGTCISGPTDDPGNELGVFARTADINA